MSLETDIRSTPEVVRLALDAAGADRERGPWGDLERSPVLFLGSGSSHFVAQSAARLCERRTGLPAQAFLPSEYLPRPGWLHVGISRTGQTTELIEALQAARDTGARILLIVGEAGSPSETLADYTLALPFAAEQGVVQSRFITACLAVLRVLINGEDLTSLPGEIERGLGYDPGEISQPHVVYLGRDWRQGLAGSAALTLQESALEIAEHHQTLDYRHGPIACAGPDTVVWCFDGRDDEAANAVLRDVTETGARVRHTGDDPLVSLAQAQLLAAHRASLNGVDPEAPRHLSRAILLPEGSGR